MNDDNDDGDRFIQLQIEEKLLTLSYRVFFKYKRVYLTNSFFSQNEKEDT